MRRLIHSSFFLFDLSFFFLHNLFIYVVLEEINGLFEKVDFASNSLNFRGVTVCHLEELFATDTCCCLGVHN